MLLQERIFIGTPGSYYWQGQTYSQNLWNRLDLIATEEGPETEDNTYLGNQTRGGMEPEDINVTHSSPSLFAFYP